MTPAEAPLIAGLKDIADRFDAFLVDLWGVVHDGCALYPDTLDALSALRRAGKKVVFLSNSPSRAQAAAYKLAGFGIDPDLYHGIVTGGEVTYRLLCDRTDPEIRELGPRVYDIDGGCGAGLLEGVPRQTYVRTPDEADFLLTTVTNLPIGEPLTLYDGVLTRARKRNLPLLCANPDRVVMVGPSMHYCPGAVAERYETMGGQVIRIGKPYPRIYAHAFDMLGNIDRSRMAAVGDSLATDISGACEAGISGILNLAGIHREEMYDNRRSPYPNPDKLRARLNTHPHKPDYLIQALRW